MKNSQIVEEPCEVKVSSTVLKTSVEGDFFTEFNKWNWVERSDWSMVEKAAAILADPSNHSRMIDLESTANMVCLDNLPPHEIASLMMAYANGHDSNSELSLVGADDRFPQLPEMPDAV